VSTSSTRPDPSSGERAEAQPQDRVRSKLVGAGRVFAVVVGPVLAIAGLKLGKTVLVPLVAGIFLAIIVRPIQSRLRAVLPRRLQWLGLVAAMLTILAGLAAFGGAVTFSGRAVADEFKSRRTEIESQLARVRAVASRVGLDIPGGQEQSAQGGAQSGAQGSAQGEPQSGPQGGAQGGRAERTLRSVVAGVTALLLTLAFAALGLAEADEVRRRIAHTGNGGGAQRALAAIDEAVPAFRRYVWVKSLTSAITGLATWLAALAFGLPLAWVWGFLAFLLEYVPSVGSAIAIVPPTLMALAEGGLSKAVAVFLVIGSLQVFFGNVVDPRLEGKLMSLSPFGVLLSIVFWGWLWGPAGALLAVPLTVAVVIACRHIPGARGVATVAAGDGVPEEDNEKR
jgi:predicted PurR-regulated permease PerM